MKTPAKPIVSKKPAGKPTAAKPTPPKVAASKPAAKPVEATTKVEPPAPPVIAEPVAKPEPVVPAPVPVTMEDLRAAISARYPQHNISSPNSNTVLVTIPGGMFYIDRAKALACTSVAELRTYIASLVVQ